MPRLKLALPCLLLIAALWTPAASAQQQPSTSQAGQDVVAKTGSWANFPNTWTVTLESKAEALQLLWSGYIGVRSCPGVFTATGG